ncbi:MAG: YihY/virulence factor BrkB family protein, partial [Gemmatimonadota bacterium]
MLKQIFVRAAREWFDDNAPRLGAALSYYTLFALAPLLVIAIAVAGLVFGREAARGQIVGEIDGFLGRQAASMIQVMLEGASKPGASIIATIAGLVTFFLGATGVFVELQGALNVVWDVRRKAGGGIRGFTRDYLVSFGLVVGVGFLLLVSLVLSALMSALGKYMDSFTGSVGVAVRLGHAIGSFLVITLLFTMIYKVLPDVKLQWRDVWRGAAVTALLFSGGKFLIGLYLGGSAVASTYGAAASLVLLMLWVYYSSQIVLFGAELTQAWVT